MYFETFSPHFETLINISYLVDILTVQELDKGGYDIDQSIHALGHLIVSLIPIFILLPDDSTIRSECRSPNSTRDRGTRLLIYGSIKKKSLLHAAFLFLKEVLLRAYQVVYDCDCMESCPGCVQSRICKYGNVGLEKAGAKLILEKQFNFKS